MTAWPACEPSARGGREVVRQRRVRAKVRVGASTGGGGDSGPGCMSNLIAVGVVCAVVGFVIPYAR